MEQLIDLVALFLKLMPDEEDILPDVWAYCPMAGHIAELIILIVETINSYYL